MVVMNHIMYIGTSDDLKVLQQKALCISLYSLSGIKKIGEGIDVQGFLLMPFVKYSLCFVLRSIWRGL